MENPTSEKELLEEINRYLKKLNPSQQKTLLKLLKTGSVEVVDTADEGLVTVTNRYKKSLRRLGKLSKRKFPAKDKKPSDFGGLWKDRNIDADELRKKAWDNRGV